MKYNQGELDGLCGMYALINGVHSLLKSPASFKDPKDRMFSVVANALPKKCYPKVLWCGTNFAELRTMAKALILYIESELDGRARFSLKSMFKADEFSDVRSFLKAVSEEHDPRIDVTILGIAWKSGGGHWVALKRIDREFIHVIDSSKERRYERSKLGFSGRKDRLVAHEVLRIRLTHWNYEKV